MQPRDRVRGAAAATGTGTSAGRALLCVAVAVLALAVGVHSAGDTFPVVSAAQLTCMRACTPKSPDETLQCSDSNMGVPACACAGGCMCSIGSCTDWCITSNPYTYSWYFYSSGSPDPHYRRQRSLSSANYLGGALNTPANVAECLRGCSLRGSCTRTTPNPPQVSASCAGGVVTAANFNTLRSCNAISGNLTLTGWTATTPLTFSAITRIGGSLEVLDNSGLTGQLSFPSLTAVGGAVAVRGNPLLTSINAPVLRTVGGYFLIHTGNTQLTTLNGFTALRTIASGFVVRGSALTDVDGLGQLSSVGSVLLWSNPSMTSASLPSLTHCNGTLTIARNNALVSITMGPLSASQSVTIDQNPVLQTLNGFTLLTAIDGDLTVSNCAQLSSVERFSALVNVTSIRLDAVGALTTFSFPHIKTLSALRLYRLPLPFIDGDSVLPALVALDALAIGYNSALTTVYGFSAITQLKTQFVVEYNPLLTAVTGFGPLLSVAYNSSIDIEIQYNAKLSSLSALSSATQLGALTLQGLPDLVQLNDFNRVTRLSGTLKIQAMGGGSANLTNVNGLSRLSVVMGKLIINVNTVSSLTGLCGLTYVQLAWETGTYVCQAAVDRIRSGVSIGSYTPSTPQDCVNGVNNAVCDCNAPTPCFNGANCVAPTGTSGAAGHYTCSCATGYTNARCETLIDSCASAPCTNGATCVNGIGSYTCECVNGYTGPRCQTDINECDGDPCEHGATCVDRIGYYNCTCAVGWAGPNCADPDFCLSLPCTNGGTCATHPLGWTCACPSGFEGESCDTDIDECTSMPCVRGTCHDLRNGFTCQCPDGYSGATCASAVNECASAPCQNGATCVDGTASYTCTCAAGFRGRLCATDINECASEPCANGGVCVDGRNKFECQCVGSWTGPTCSTPVTACSSAPCLNGATCEPHNDGTYECVCLRGYSGTRCQTNIDECASSPCANEGTCVDGYNRFYCACLPQYTGPTCSIARTGTVIVRLQFSPINDTRAFSYYADSQTGLLTDIATVLGVSPSRFFTTSVEFTENANGGYTATVRVLILPAASDSEVAALQLWIQMRTAAVPAVAVGSQYGAQYLNTLAQWCPNLNEYIPGDKCGDAVDGTADQPVDRTPTDWTPVIVGCVVGGVVLIVLIVLIWKRKQICGPKEPKTHPTPKGNGITPNGAGAVGGAAGAANGGASPHHGAPQGFVDGPVPHRPSVQAIELTPAVPVAPSAGNGANLNVPQPKPITFRDAHGHEALAAPRGSTSAASAAEPADADGDGAGAGAAPLEIITPLPRGQAGGGVTVSGGADAKAGAASGARAPDSLLPPGHAVTHSMGGTDDLPGRTLMPAPSVSIPIRPVASSGAVGGAAGAEPARHGMVDPLVSSVSSSDR